MRRLLIRLCSWQPLCSGQPLAAGSGQSGLCLPAAVGVSSTEAQSSERHQEFSGSEQKIYKILLNRKKGGPLIGQSDSFSAPHMSPPPSPSIWWVFFPFTKTLVPPTAPAPPPLPFAPAAVSSRISVGDSVHPSLTVPSLHPFLSCVCSAVKPSWIRPAARLTCCLCWGWNKRRC